MMQRRQFMQSAAVAALGIDPTDDEYGAAGDGEADDTDAIQSAINDLSSGGIVHLPAGDYRITDSIKLHSGVTLTGDGPGATRILAKGKFSAVRNRHICLDSSPDAYIGVREMTIEGPGKDTPGHDRGILLADVVKSTVENIYVQQFSGHGIEVAAAVQCNVGGCWVNRVGDDGVSISDAYYADTRDLGPGAIQRTQHVTVSDTTVRYAGNSGIEVDDGPRFVKIDGCHAQDGDYGYQVHYHDDRNSTFEYPQYPPNSIHIVDCTVDNVYMGVHANATRTPADGSGIGPLKIIGGDFELANERFGFNGDVESTVIGHS